MAISFNQIPAGMRVPFAYVEFDASGARRGSSVQPYKILVMGQKTSSGSVDELVPTRVTSKEQAAAYFGAGSLLHGMFTALFANNKTTEAIAIAIDDATSSAAAVGALLFGGTLANGTLNLYIAGRLVRVPVLGSDTLAGLATRVAAVINANPALPVTAAVDGEEDKQVNLTAKNKGTLGNQIDVRLNYQDGEETPAGLTVAITAMADGATDPDVSEIIAVMGEDMYNLIALPWVDGTSLGAIEAELADRWGPIRMADGVAVAARNASHATLGTLGNSRNSEHLVVLGTKGMPTPPWEYAAAVAGVAALSAQVDPARPFQTLPVFGVLPPASADRFTIEERNLLLHDGISTHTVDAGGTVRVERLITTYKTNPLGAADEAYLDLTTLLTISYLRYDFRNYFMGKYPRHKLASDGTRFAPGQAVITPKIGKAEAIAKFREWEGRGLVENIDQFKEELIVERNSQDPNRLDFFLPPDLVNQLVVTAVKIGFRL